MAFTRSHLYNDRDQETSFFFKALGHPARLMIIRKLNKDGSCTVGDLHKWHPISLPALSQHIGILRRAHILDFREKYPYTYYSLNPKNYKKVKRVLKSFLDEM